MWFAVSWCEKRRNLSTALPARQDRPSAMGQRLCGSSPYLSLRRGRVVAAKLGGFHSQLLGVGEERNGLLDLRSAVKPERVRGVPAILVGDQLDLQYTLDGDAVFWLG